MASSWSFPFCGAFSSSRTHQTRMVFVAAPPTVRADVSEGQLLRLLFFAMAFFNILLRSGTLRYPECGDSREQCEEGRCEGIWINPNDPDLCIAVDYLCLTSGVKCCGDLECLMDRSQYYTCNTEANLFPDAGCCSVDHGSCKSKELIPSI